MTTTLVDPRVATVTTPLGRSNDIGEHVAATHVAQGVGLTTEMGLEAPALGVELPGAHSPGAEICQTILPAFDLQHH